MDVDGSAHYTSDDTDEVRYRVVDGMHCFRAGPGCAPVSIDMPLTGGQVEFLSRNPAAMRCCLVKGSFGPEWLEALIASIEVIDGGGSTVH